MKNAMLIGTGALLLLFGIPLWPSRKSSTTRRTSPPNHPTPSPPTSRTPSRRRLPRIVRIPITPPSRRDRTKPNRLAQRPEEAQRNNEHAGNGRIPDDKIAHFGREHTFHVGHPVIVEGHPRFQYGGYSFVIAQPWPAGWGYNDDVYVVDVNGVYYLMDLAHPGVQLELQVVL